MSARPRALGATTAYGFVHAKHASKFDTTKSGAKKHAVSRNTPNIENAMKRKK